MVTSNCVIITGQFNCWLCVGSYANSFTLNCLRFSSWKPSNSNRCFRRAFLRTTLLFWEMKISLTGNRLAPIQKSFCLHSQTIFHRKITHFINNCMHLASEIISERVIDRCFESWKSLADRRAIKLRPATRGWVLLHSTFTPGLPGENCTSQMS